MNSRSLKPQKIPGTDLRRKWKEIARIRVPIVSGDELTDIQKAISLSKLDLLAKIPEEFIERTTIFCNLVYDVYLIAIYLQSEEEVREEHRRLRESQQRNAAKRKAEEQLRQARKVKKLEAEAQKLGFTLISAQDSHE